MLGFLAEHHRVTVGQVSALVAGPPQHIHHRLHQLEQAGYVARDPDLARPCYSIRSPGLAAVGSELRPPSPSLRSHWHDVGTAALWLSAWNGNFGPVAVVVGERRMRSHDEAPGSPDDLYAVRLGGLTERGRERRHYPDLMLVDHRGRRLALELELSSKGLARREAIIAGYGADRRLDGVIYLIENNRNGRSIGRTIAATARRLGLDDRVHVRPVMPIVGEPGCARAVAAAARPRHETATGVAR